MLRRTVSLFLQGDNPYGESLAELLEQARIVRLRGPRQLGTRVQAPRPRYSNLGFELLGHAIAAAAGMSYRDLVTARLSGPLALDSVYMPASPRELGTAALTGTNRWGRSRQPWTGEALAPAGGIRASIQDLARLAAALLDGTAPGISALDPVAQFAGPAVHIGAAWLTLDAKGQRITWHNGGTGGFSTWIGLDREAKAAVVLLSATAAPVDRPGFELLRELAAR